MRPTLGWEGRNAVLLTLVSVFFSAILCVGWLPYAYFVRWAWQSLALPLALFVTILAVFSAVMTTALVVPLGVRLVGVSTPVGRHSVYSWPAIRWALSNSAVLVLRWLGLEMLRCTPWMNLYLRLMGARIGNRVIVNSTYLYDLDLLEIGDGAVIGGDALIMAHTMEEGRLTLSPVRIGAGVTIGQSAVVLGGSEIGDGATIGAMALVPRNARVPANERWAGVPARRLGPPGGQAALEQSARAGD